MPLGEANRLAPCHTCSRVRGHGKALYWGRGTRGNEVPLLRYSQCGHPARTHLSQSRGGGGPAPTTSHAISRTLKRLGISHEVKSGEPFTTDRNREYRDKSRKRRYTCGEAALITMDQLPLPLRCASVNTALVRDMCPSANGPANLPRYCSCGKLWAPPGKG